MRILHIDKFAGKLAAIAGGPAEYIRMVRRMQEDAGHEVKNFGCVGKGESAEMPTFRRLDRSKNPLNLLRIIHSRGAARKLRRFLDSSPADVAHLHNIYHHLTPSILPVLASRSVAIVMTAHDYNLACPARHFWREDGLCERCRQGSFYHAASPRCKGLAGAGLAIESLFQRWLGRYSRWIDRFICPSQFMVEVLADAGIPRVKLIHLPHPVELPASDERPSKIQRRLVYAGRLSREKGPDMMLDLAERFDDVEVVLAGDGPMLPQLRSEVEARQLSNVKFMGWLDKAELRRLFAESAATVIPSRCTENSPLVMLESMAAGGCVIAPNQKSICEDLVDSVTGRTFITGDRDSLYAAVYQILADSTVRDALAAAAQERVLRRHNPGNNIEALTAIYEDAIQRCASQ